MRNFLFFAAAAAGIGVAGYSQNASTGAERCLRVRTSFELIVHASYAETAPLFGPEGERAWVEKHWDPQFVYPLPARDEEGMVFTLQRGPYNEVWVNTRFDLKGRHFHYVYYMANLVVTTIDLHFESLDQSDTQVKVTYTRTAVTPEGNRHVTAMSEVDQRADKEWAQKIDAFLWQRKP
jgi:hypothetical protein